MATTKRKTRSVAGGLTFMRRPYVLNYRDTKPTVAKIQLVRGNVIKGDAVVAYAAQAANVPETTILMAQAALFDAINYFCTNGHRVEVPGLGSFGPVTKVKCVQSAEDLTAETIKARGLRFWPKRDIGDLANLGNLSLTENKTLTAMACGACKTSVDGTEYVTDAFGKLLTFDDKAYKMQDGEAVEGEISPSVTGYGSFAVPKIGEGKFQLGGHVYEVANGKLTPAPTLSSAVE